MMNVVDPVAPPELSLPAGIFMRVVRNLPAPHHDLPPQIRACAPKRQNSFAAGRRAALQALQAAGSGAQAWPGIGPDGLPVWPPGWRGSISHTDRLAAAAVTPRVTILGIDIEGVVSAQTARDIAPSVLPEHPDATLLEVTRGFSAKEALYKALYPSTRQFRDFTAAQLEWTQTGAALTLTEDWSPQWPRGTVLLASQAMVGDHVLSMVWG